MPRFALTFSPGAPPARMEEVADRFERLLQGSVRATDTTRTLLPGLAAVTVLTRFFPNRPQPAVSDDGTIYVWLDGEIWDRAAARQLLDLEAKEDLSDTELCLRLFLRFGDSFAERLNGQFIVVMFDTVRKRVVATNDRYSFRPLFWQARDGALTCATEIKPVLAASVGKPEVDPAGVMELLAYGHQMCDRTLFKDVNVLPPAGRLIYERGEARIERYWKFRYPQEAARDSEYEIGAELARRIRVACARQVEGPGRVGIALSAGLDSRMVIAGLPQDGVTRSAYTIGPPDSLEVLGARQLAQTFGFRHQDLPPEAEDFTVYGPEVVWRTEGCFPFYHAMSLQYHERIRPEMDIIMTGHGGGALSGQTLPWFPILDEGKFDVDDYLFSHTFLPHKETFRSLFPDAVYQNGWPAARQRFRATVDEVTGQRPGDAIIAWNMERRQARFTHHSGQVDRYDFEVRAPLLDSDVVDFCVTIPYKYRFAQRLYTRALAEQFPEAARVPWSKTGKPVPGSPLEILSNFYMNGARRQVVKRVPALARNRKDAVGTGTVLAQAMRQDPLFRSEILDPFVRGDSFPDHILDRAAVTRVLDEHWGGVHDHGHLVGCFATLAMVYRHFLEHGLQAPSQAAAPRVLEVA